MGRKEKEGQERVYLPGTSQPDRSHADIETETTNRTDVALFLVYKIYLLTHFTETVDSPSARLIEQPGSPVSETGSPISHPMHH